MKRFRFPLRPVAILRAHHELRARETFAAAVHAFVTAERELEAARERVRMMAEALTTGRAVQFSAADEIRAIAAYRQECENENKAEQARAAAEKAMNDKRAEYIEAHRKLEVVKRLEEKARASHRYETMREEQAEFDDYSNRRFGRRALESA